MLETDGVPPKLAGQECEEIICQQCWLHDQILQEVDVLFIKVNGKWNQLYFENGTIFWRLQDQEPTAYKPQEGDLFRYPFIDLGHEYGISNHLISDCLSEQIPAGVRVTLVFESVGQLQLSSSENKSRLKFIRQI